MSHTSLTFRPLRAGEESAVTALWQKAGLIRPWNDPATDIAFALGGPASDILVASLEGALVASVMVGHDGHRGAVYYVSVDPAHKGKGFGRQVMDAAEDWLKARGVWKLNLMVREDNAVVHGFYEALGYEAEPRAVYAKRLKAET